MASVRVPATIANFGPAFDALGLAVTRHNYVTAAVAPAPRVQVEGLGRGTLAEDPSNLVYRAAAAVAERARRAAAFHVHCRNEIPLGRGLGSSAAAIAGGVLAANTALGRPLGQPDLLDIAWKLEGHPDNVAAALLGGVVLADTNGGVLRTTRFLPRWDAVLVVAVPDYAVSTGQARAVLPDRVPHADAAANAGRAAWLVTAMLVGRPDLLEAAMRDALHQPYRRTLVPGMEEVMTAARTAGAYGAALCGSGPSIVAVAPPAHAEAVGRRMVEAFAGAGHGATYLQVGVDEQGATVLEE